LYTKIQELKPADVESVKSPCCRICSALVQPNRGLQAGRIQILDEDVKM